MEVWEGAILAVGGIWLIGRLSRKSSAHPVNSLAPVAFETTLMSGMGNTVGTNQAGDSNLVGGETLLAAPPLPPVRSPVIHAPIVMPPRPTPVAPKEAPVARTPYTPAPPTMRPTPKPGSFLAPYYPDVRRRMIEL